MSKYYLPEPSHWPLKGSVAILTLLCGIANWLHGESFGPWMVLVGFLMVLYMAHGWFAEVFHENRTGMLDDKQVGNSFRWGMIWFIFSEVMFFGAFFGALFYTRIFSVPMLGGTYDGVMTNLLLWPNFKPLWPMLHTPSPSAFVGPHSVMDTWGLPAINTLILLTSGATITVAHWAVLKGQRAKMILFQLLTALLGVAFLCCQVHEYMEAYMHKGLTLGSGMYGTTFFMLTGFHGLHVTIGTIGLFTILYRMIRGDITSKNHFSFEAISWYWHFVDVVWLLLFVFVYWL